MLYIYRKVFYYIMSGCSITTSVLVMIFLSFQRIAEQVVLFCLIEQSENSWGFLVLFEHEISFDKSAPCFPCSVSVLNRKKGRDTALHKDPSCNLYDNI